LFVPEGFAHGFCVLSERADVIYKCTEIFRPGDDYGICWADETIGLDWPIDKPILSDKDSRNPKLAEIAEERLPRYSK
jgi:dTDP-4-dehydrorhamnose 3,5-epimerase